MNPEVTARKETLRRVANERRVGLDSIRAEAAGRALTERLVARPEYGAAHHLGVYLSVPGEISTGPLIARIRSDGKALCLPAWLDSCRDYDWVEFDPGACLAQGPFGIPQPERPVPLAGLPVDLVVVPGLAFDAQGGRLGHGKGIYDRLLVRPLLRGALKIGWAFDFQMWDEIPQTERDVRLDEVMTETHDNQTPRASGKNKEERSC